MSHLVLLFLYRLSLAVTITSISILSLQAEASSADVDNAGVSITEVSNAASKNVENEGKKSFSLVESPIYDEEIERWMLQASFSIRRERLTSPAKSSAVYFYQKILALNPNYGPALQGLANLPMEYIKLAHSAFNQEDFPKVRRVLNRVVTVYGQDILLEERKLLERELQLAAPHLARLHLLDQPKKKTLLSLANANGVVVTEKSIEKEKSLADKKSVVEGQTFVAKNKQVQKPNLVAVAFDPINPASDPSKNSEQTKSTSKTISKQTSKPALKPVLKTTKQPKLQKITSISEPSTKEKRWMSQAQLLIERRQWWRAEKVLKRALSQSEVTDNTRLMLLDVLAKQAKWPQYQTILLSLVDVPATARSVLRAKMLLKIQQPEYAVVELENNPPSINDYLDYYAVWALALQKAKRYNQAQKKYLALLALEPHNPRYWLGLSIAYSGEGQASESCRAMQQVPKASVNSKIYLLNARVNNYVRHHLEKYCRPLG